MGDPSRPELGDGSGASSSPVVVGYAFLAKKLGTMARIVQDSTVHEEEGRPLEFRPIDLDQPLEPQVRPSTKSPRRVVVPPELTSVRCMGDSSGALPHNSAQALGGYHASGGEHRGGEAHRAPRSIRGRSPGGRAGRAPPPHPSPRQQAGPSRPRLYERWRLTVRAFVGLCVVTTGPRRVDSCSSCATLRRTR
jgi:hypothetical protein